MYKFENNVSIEYQDSLIEKYKRLERKLIKCIDDLNQKHYYHYDDKLEKLFKKSLNDLNTLFTYKAISKKDYLLLHNVLCDWYGMINNNINEVLFEKGLEW